MKIITIVVFIVIGTSSALYFLYTSGPVKSPPVKTVYIYDTLPTEADRIRQTFHLPPEYAIIPYEGKYIVSYTWSYLPNECQYLAYGCNISWWFYNKKYADKFDRIRDALCAIKRHQKEIEADRKIHGK